MKRYTIIHPIAMSFFSKSLYQDAGRNWEGVGFLYLLLLIVLCTIPGMFKFHSIISDFVINQVPSFVQQIPEITISQGEVSINQPEPYFIKDPDDDNLLIIIDTTGKYTSLEGTEALALLSETKLIFKQSERETRTYDLSGIAITPGLILGTIFNNVGNPIPKPAWGIICFLLALGYLFYGVKANAEITGEHLNVGLN